MAVNGKLSTFLLKWILILIIVTFVANVVMFIGIKPFINTQSNDMEEDFKRSGQSAYKEQKEQTLDDVKDLFEYHKTGHKKTHKHKKLEYLREKYEETKKEMDKNLENIDYVKGELAERNMKGLQNIPVNEIVKETFMDKKDTPVKDPVIGNEDIAVKKTLTDKKDTPVKETVIGNEDIAVKETLTDKKDTPVKETVIDNKDIAVKRTFTNNKETSEITHRQKEFKSKQAKIKGQYANKKNNNFPDKLEEREMVSNNSVELYKAKTAKQQNETKLVQENTPNRKQDQDTDATCFMTMYKAKGELGNQVFQLASLIGLADRHNCTPFLPMAGFNINSVFVLPMDTYKDIKTINFNKLIPDPHAADSGVELTKYKYFPELGQRKNWTLDGYFQSFKYFLHVNDKLKTYLRLKKSQLRSAREFVDRVPSGHVKVAIHIRRRDYISSFQATIGRVPATPEYVHNAMKYFQNKYHQVTFLVVSDEMPWCKRVIPTPAHNNIMFSTFTEPGIDMAVMSLCNHAIISVGAFGWWGGWLTEGDVVYFDGYPRPYSDLDRKFVKEDYYPPSWIPMT